MAKSVIIPIKSVFDDKGLKQAGKQFGSLGKSLKGLLGAAGLTVGLAQVTQFLQQSSKAAAEDAKSQALLANGLRNSVGATQGQIAAVEESIRQMQLQAAVADDVIRPAFDQLARSTGSLEQATRLTNIALDVSAATGRDLGSVSVALGKAVNGSTTALSRLGINVKGVADPIGMLEQRFDGAAEAAANTDPFQRLTIAFGELQEQVGQALLPELNDLADWLTSPEVVGGLDYLIGEFKQFVSDTTDAGDALVYLGQQLANFFSFLPQIDMNEQSNPVVKFLNDIDNAWFRVSPVLGGIVGLLNMFNDQVNPKDPSAARYKALEDYLKAQKAAQVVFTGSGTGGGTGSATGLTDAQKRALELAKRQAEAYKKILETEAKIREEALQAAQETNAAIFEMRDSFTALLDGVKPLQRAGSEIGEFEAQVVDSFAAIEEAISSALSDGTLLQDAANNLRAYAASESATLKNIARQRDALTKKIDIAKAISSGVLAVGDITGLVDTQTRTVTESFTQMVNGIKVVVTRSFDEITRGGIVDNFKKVIDKTKQYAKNLIELKRLGLNGQLFKQIVDAGVEGGSDAAQAIADGGQATVTELNSLFGELNKLGANIAETSTDIMYEAGTDVMNSFIQSLLDQDAALEATAITLAEKFAQAFRSRLVGLTPLAAMPMNTADISLSDALTGYVSDSLGRTFTGPYNYYGQQMVGGLGANYNININAGVVANKAELGDFLAATLKQYTRVNGPIGIS